jgi:hypothetical protein
MTVCGPKDDTVDVEEFAGNRLFTKEFVMLHQAAIGQLVWKDTLGAFYDDPGNVEGMRWATGVLVADDLFLTAGHNFRNLDLRDGVLRPRKNRSLQIIEPPEIATNMIVSFNYQFDEARKLRPEIRLPVVELLEYFKNDLDFAVVRLQGTPGLQFGFKKAASADAIPNDPACIIQHPKGKPKRVDNGPVSDVNSKVISYQDIDTFAGSSGSPLINADGDIIGIHTHPGCDPMGVGSNHGVPISAIKAVSAYL